MFPDNNFYAEKFEGEPPAYALPLPYGAYKGIIYYGDTFTSRKYPLLLDSLKLGEFGYLAFTDGDDLPQFAFESWAGYLLGDSNVEVEMYQKGVYGYKLIFGFEEWIMEGVQWLFETGLHYWSTQATTVGAQAYTAKVLPSSFDGIEMRCDLAGGFVAPSDLSIEISDPAAAITPATLEGEEITVKLVLEEVITRSWKFKVKHAVRYYGKIHLHCVDILQDYLIGDFPNTPHPKELWPSTDTDPEDLDAYRIPVIYGTAYVPVQSVYVGPGQFDRYYVLGIDDTYTLSEVHTPKEWSIQATWAAATYDFNQSTVSGYRMAQFEIFQDEDGVMYPGVWRSGAGFLRPLVKMSRTATASTTNPAAWFGAILQAFGVPSGDINVTNTTQYSTRSIEFNGGFWMTEYRESILQNLLMQCDSYLSVTSTISPVLFSKTPVETFDYTDIKRSSYRSSMQTRYTADGARVAWAIDGQPQDDLAGKTTVPASNGGTITELDRETPNCGFINNSITAQKAGILRAQKKLLQKDAISFEASGLNMASLATIVPGQVVRVNDALYGGQADSIITNLRIGKGIAVNISATRLETLEDWDDITVAAVVVPVDAIADPVAPLMSQEIDGEVLVITWTMGQQEYPIDYYILYVDAVEIGKFKDRRYVERIAWFGSKIYSVEAVDISGRTGPEGTVTVTIDDLITPTALTATGKPYEVQLEMTYTKTTLWEYVEIWGAKNANTRTTAELIKESAATEYGHEGLDNADTWYYWIRTKDVFGNVSGWFPDSATAGISASPTLVNTADIEGSAVTEGAVYTWATSQNGNGAYQSWTNNFTISEAGRVTVHLSYRQGFTAGGVTWGIRIQIDGVTVNDAGTATSIQDIVSLMGSRNCSAGVIPIKVEWYGADSTASWANRVLVAQIFKR